MAHRTRNASGQFVSVARRAARVRRPRRSTTTTVTEGDLREAMRKDRRLKARRKLEAKIRREAAQAARKNLERRLHKPRKRRSPGGRSRRGGTPISEQPCWNKLDSPSIYPSRSPRA